MVRIRKVEGSAKFAVRGEALEREQQARKRLSLKLEIARKKAGRKAFKKELRTTGKRAGKLGKSFLGAIGALGGRRRGRVRVSKAPVVSKVAIARLKVEIARRKALIKKRGLRDEFFSASGSDFESQKAKRPRFLN